MRMLHGASFFRRNCERLLSKLKTLRTKSLTIANSFANRTFLLVNKMNCFVFLVEEFNGMVVRKVSYCSSVKC